MSTLKSSAEDLTLNADGSGNDVIIQSNASTKVTVDGSAGDVKVESGDLFFATAGKGIVLGATSNTDANTLDDYEEGTWTASFTAGTGTITKNTSYDLCRYTKVGRLVNVAGRLNVSSVSTPSGEWRITGLPETINNNTDGELSGTATASIWLESLGSSINAHQAYGVAGATDIMIKEFNGTSDANMADKVQAGTNVFFSFTYTV